MYHLIRVQTNYFKEPLKFSEKSIQKNVAVAEMKQTNRKASFNVDNTTINRRNSAKIQFKIIFSNAIYTFSIDHNNWLSDRIQYKKKQFSNQLRSEIDV